MEVFYQAVEQSYNTEEDPRWFEHGDNWPKSPSRVVAAVQGLIALKRKGLPIRNSYPQLEAMIPYFQNPDAMRVAVQSHTAHLLHPVCSALTNIQILPNGDVLACYGMPPIGNIRTTPIREIWHNRPAWAWRAVVWSGAAPTPKEALGLTTIAAAAERRDKEAPRFIMLARISHNVAQPMRAVSRLISTPSPPATECRVRRRQSADAARRVRARHRAVWNVCEKAGESAV